MAAPAPVEDEVDPLEAFMAEINTMAEQQSEDATKKASTDASGDLSKVCARLAIVVGLSFVYLQ